MDARATTGYILIATRLEERDLVAQFGEVYEDYRRRVPAFIPLGRPDGSGVVAERPNPGAETPPA